MTGRSSKAASAVSISPSRWSTSSGQFVGSGVLFLEAVVLGAQRVVARLLLLGELGGLAGQAAQAGGVAVRELGRDLDPFPALGAQRLGLRLELLDRPAGRAAPGPAASRHRPARTDRA